MSGPLRRPAASAARAVAVHRAAPGRPAPGRCRHAAHRHPAHRDRHRDRDRCDGNRRGRTPTAAAGSTGTGGGDSARTDGALTALLAASTTKWAAAASSSMTAGPLELASGAAVMSIGGFNGSDNAITLARFEALVQAGDIHYFIASGSGGGMGGASGVFSQISTWVAAHYTAKTVGPTTVYDLTVAK